MCSESQGRGGGFSVTVAQIYLFMCGYKVARLNLSISRGREGNVFFAEQPPHLSQLNVDEGEEEQEQEFY